MAELADALDLGSSGLHHRGSSPLSRICLKIKVSLVPNNPTQVAAAIIVNDNRILIGKRKAGRFADKWEFPGGKVEQGETPEECLKREIGEELGVDVRIGEFFLSNVHAYDHATIELMAYKAGIVSGDLCLRDHSEIRWVVAEDLPLYDFPEADRPTIEKLMAESREVGLRTLSLQSAEAT